MAPTKELSADEIEQALKAIASGDSLPEGLTFDAGATPPVRRSTEQDIFEAKHGVRFDAHGKIVNSHFSQSDAPGGTNYQPEAADAKVIDGAAGEAEKVLNQPATTDEKKAKP